MLHSRNRPTATDWKKIVFSILVAISLVGTISAKIVATRCHILNSISSGAPPQTPLHGELIAVP